MVKPMPRNLFSILQPLCGLCITLALVGLFSGVLDLGVTFLKQTAADYAIILLILLVVALSLMWLLQWQTAAKARKEFIADTHSLEQRLNERLAGIETKAAAYLEDERQRMLTENSDLLKQLEKFKDDEKTRMQTEFEEIKAENMKLKEKLQQRIDSSVQEFSPNENGILHNASSGP